MGRLQVTSTNGSSAEYHAVRIADPDGLPINTSFDWPALSGAQAPGHKPYPTYDPNGPLAAAHGRALVERVSADLTKDEDGSLAQWLSVKLQPKAPYTAVVTDAGPVEVENGWYILTATGRRPLFAWVKGDLVTLGDKSDTPVLDKEINAGDGWGSAALGGSGRVFKYRTTITVPHTFDLYSTYKLTLHDEHDQRLVLDAQSLKVELLRLAGDTDDQGNAMDVIANLTKDAELATAGSTFTVTIPNLKNTPARVGDVIRVSYSMTADPLVTPGADGLVNDAYATFPAMGGEGQTPHDATRAYLMHARVHKVNEKGANLVGARFGIQNDQDAWLLPNGTFGKMAQRAEFESNKDGMIEQVPALAPGRYKLVELEAPAGYALPKQPAFAFEVSAACTQDNIELEVEATQPLTVEDVSGEQASFTLKLVNDPKGTSGGFIPQTGDAPWLLAAGALACAGGLVLAAGMRYKRSRTQ